MVANEGGEDLGRDSVVIDVSRSTKHGLPGGLAVTYGTSCAIEVIHPRIKVARSERLKERPLEIGNLEIGPYKRLERGGEGEDRALEWDVFDVVVRLVEPPQGTPESS